MTPDRKDCKAQFLPDIEGAIAADARASAPAGEDERLFSFVATSRNDDHGGDALRRTQSFIRCLALQCERHRLRGELVLVDWNPPSSRAPLAEALDWPPGNGWFAARVISVPHEVHLLLPHARTLAMFQMIAKNVGVRRASGDYVVATNIDIIFSDELFRWLKTADLDDRCVYRSDRWDIPNDIQLETDFDVLLQRARQETIRKNLKEGTIEAGERAYWPSAVSRIDSLLIRPIQTRLGAIRDLLRDGGDPAALLDEFAQRALPELRDFYVAADRHMNGCGDFTMLSAKGWRELRGYPEWPVFSWNIDSVLLAQAGVNGYAERIAPSNAPHYHIEHSYGSGYTPQGADSLFRRMDQRSIAYVSWEDFSRLVSEMCEEARVAPPVLFNDEGWGMADMNLPEVIRSKAAPAAPAHKGNATPLVESFDATDLAAERVSPIDAECCQGAKVNRDHSDNAAVYSVSTPAAPWAFALKIKRPHAIGSDRPYWVRFRCRALQGVFGFGVLSPGEREFRIEMSALPPQDGWREIVLLAPPLCSDTLVLRNREVGPCRIEMTDLEFFWEIEPSEIKEKDKASGWLVLSANW